MLPRRVSLCRMQLQEARFGSPLRGDLSAERPSWFRGHGWAQGAEGLRAPSPACPRRRTRGEWVSGARDPQQSSSAQGARGSPASPYGERRARGENSLRCFHEPRQVGDVVCCWKSFPLQNAEQRSSFWAFSGTGPRRLAAELAQGTWLGPGRRRPSRAQSCFLTKENPWGVGFSGRRPPAKQQDPGSQGQPSPALPSGEWRAGGENG